MFSDRLLIELSEATVAFGCARKRPCGRVKVPLEIEVGLAELVGNPWHASSVSGDEAVALLVGQHSVRFLGRVEQGIAHDLILRVVPVSFEPVFHIGQP